MKIIKISAMWCSGCLSMKKIWKSIEKEYPELEIINYDYDLDSEIVEKYNIGKILPVTIFEKDGKEERLIGEQTKEQLIEKIEELK